jgi:rod shape determining protein RodA
MLEFETKVYSGSHFRFEWPLILVTLVLAVVGLCLIYSATSHMGEAGRVLVIKQITWCSLGLVLMALFLLFDYKLLEKWAIWFYLLAIVALIAVWGLGKVTAGSKRWIEISFMRLQPSEFAKLAVVIILAKYFHARVRNGEGDLKHLATALGLAAVPAVLVALQPDLGTAGVIMLVAASMILFGGMGRRALIWSGGALVVIIPILLLAGDRLLMDYQKKRLLTYLDPSYDPLGSGYHIIQSQIAIGSGGLLGKGFLQGTQNQLMFLPVKHTDFIFSILAEEMGFVGCAAVLALFAVMFLRGLDVAEKARDTFGVFLALGCVSVLFWHVVINVGMVMGMFPVVGVPLSFLSYGGSSLLASFLAISILVNVGMRRFSY